MALLRNKHRVTKTMLALTSMSIALCAGPAISRASFPGANGLISFQAVNYRTEETGLFSIRPDGIDLSKLGPPEAAGGSWSADGQRYVYVSHPSGERDQLVTMDANGDNPSVVAVAMTDAHAIAGPSFSHDGERITYQEGPKTGRPDDKLYTIAVDGSDRRVVAKSGRSRGVVGRLTSPEYSPNGRRIAFEGLPEGAPRNSIWSIRVDGTGLRRLRLGGPSYIRGLSFSPDGRWIAVGQRSVGLVRADGSQEVRHVAADIDDPVWSPDGTRIAGVTRLEFGCNHLVTFNPDGSDRQVVTDTCDYYEATRQPANVFTSSWQPVP